MRSQRKGTRRRTGRAVDTPVNGGGGEVKIRIDTWRDEKKRKPRRTAS